MKDEIFGLWYRDNSKYAMRMGNMEKYFTKETTTNNWYKVKFK